MPKKISILGSTGSIGTNALDLISRHPDRFKVVALAEGHDPSLLARQIEDFRPELVSVRDENSAQELKNNLRGYKPEVVYGLEGASLVATHSQAELVLSAIVGAAGLIPTVEAIKKGKTIALANKETLVAGGEFVTQLAKQTQAQILPVDSEHSAIYQSLRGHRKEDLVRILLTASGGPFLNFTLEEMARVGVQDALKHPRWSMGAKITIDSATMMNKGLEIIEARWLFDVEPEKIEVLIHPQSIVHSLVEYKDKCVMAELGLPDMQSPIAYALAFPERVETKVPSLDLSGVGNLTFEKPDFERFPALKLAYSAIKQGGSYPIVLNAANEVAVEYFLKEHIKFTAIADLVAKTMECHTAQRCGSVEEILEIDKWARDKTLEIVRVES